MRKEDEGQVKVGVGIEILWRALSRDLNSIIPIVAPKLVKEAEILEGDGGFGTLYLFKFGSGVSNSISYQKEKVVEFDESLHKIGLQVTEGGRLNHGFTFYKMAFQLSEIGASETLVDIKVEYEGTEIQETQLGSGETIKSGVAFIQSLETYLMKQFLK